MRTSIDTIRLIAERFVSPPPLRSQRKALVKQLLANLSSLEAQQSVTDTELLDKVMEVVKDEVHEWWNPTGASDVRRRLAPLLQKSIPSSPEAETPTAQ